jgi:nitrite reductase/ring-hydroxylating ferredoxin subunit
MKRILTVIILLFFVATGCNEDNRPVIPYVYVNVILYPNSMDYINNMGYKYVNAGYRGIVVFRISQDQFMVYERCCPFDPEKTGAKITVDPSNITCVDSVCMSKFILTDGTPYDGPSPYALMQYHWNYNGDALYISN